MDRRQPKNPYSFALSREENALSIQSTEPDVLNKLWLDGNTIDLNLSCHPPGKQACLPHTELASLRRLDRGIMLRFRGSRTIRGLQERNELWK